MTPEHRKEIMRNFLHYNNNKETVARLREDLTGLQLIPSYKPKMGKLQKGVNNKEQMLVNIMDKINELERWIKVYEKVKDTFHFDDIRRQLIEMRFEKGKSVTEIMEETFICSTSYYWNLSIILDIADKWAEELKAYSIIKKTEKTA